MDEFPDYVPPEDGGLDPDEIERTLDKMLGSSGAIRA